MDFQPNKDNIQNSYFQVLHNEQFVLREDIIC